MTEWREVTIEELAEKIAMGPFGSDIKVETFKPCGVPIISGKHLHETRMRDKGFNFISEEHADKLSNANVFRGDVIFTHAGNIGQVSFIPENSKYERYVISQRQFYLRCNSNVLDYEFIAYYFKSPYGQYQLLANANQTGVPSLAQPVSYLKSIKVLLPPLTEQKAIAEVLSSLDDKIDLLTRQNKTLEDLAQTYFRKWFIEDSAKSRTVQISDIIDFNPPRYLAKGTIAPYLEMANVSTSVFHPDDWYNREYSSGTKFVNGDTLFARITPCLENGKSTYVTFLNKGQVGWGSTEFIVMHTKNDLHPFLSYLLTKNEEFRDHAESCLEGSSGRQRVNIDHLLNFKIQVPNEKIAQTFNLIMEDIVLKLHHNFMQIRTLSKLRDILLPKLISGEIRVKM